MADIPRDLAPQQALYTFSLVLRDIMAGNGPATTNGSGDDMQVFSAVNLLRVAAIGQITAAELREALAKQGIVIKVNGTKP